MKKEKIKNAINTVVELLKNEKIEFVALAVFRPTKNKPSDFWSPMNRAIMFTHGTTDARGYRQWQEVGRYVKKGAKAFYILVPIYKTVKVKNKEVFEEIERLKANCKCSECRAECEIQVKIKELEKNAYKEVEKLVSFKAAPVFAKEDTDGEPLEEDLLKVEIPCEFESLIRELGLKITPVFYSEREGFYGRYIGSRNEIKLASPEIIVFLHELAHAVDFKINGKSIRSIEEDEFVAELSAAVIGYLLGYKIPLRHVKAYIEQFKPLDVYKALNTVEKIVEYIVERTKTEKAPPELEIPPKVQVEVI